jgi:phosphohistidine swiveling domain-containing protein
VIEWTAPAGGMWQLETTHVRGAQPRVFQERAIRGFGDGFAGPAREYGLPIDHVEVRFVNDHCYGRMVPVGAPEPKPGKASRTPPAFVLWLLARFHPELRRRATAAERTIVEKPWMSECARWDTEQRPALIAANRELQAVDLAALDDGALVDHLRRAADHFQRGMTLHFDLMPAHDIPLGRFVVACGAWGIEARDALGLLAGSSPASVASCSGLAAIARACADAGVAPQTIEDVRAASERSAQALDDYLADHGWRVVSQYSPRARTLGEQPDVLVRAIRAASTERMPVQPDSALLRARVPANDRGRFDELLGDARTTYYLRDDNVALTFMWPAGLVRRALLEVGRRLTERGALDDRDHVMALDEAEIARALGGDPALRVLAAERVARGRAAEGDGAPAMLGDDEGPPPDPKIFPAAMAELIAAALVPLELEEFGVGAPPADVAWTGEGFGTGIGTTAYTGRACVAADAEEALDRLRNGDVLVTTHTTPAFEAVMPIAGAIITENGGLMSHAALVCREQGIPAVLGVTAATIHIADGATVTVDPSTGRVLIADPTGRH